MRIGHGTDMDAHPRAKRLLLQANYLANPQIGNLTFIRHLLVRHDRL